MTDDNVTNISATNNQYSSEEIALKMSNLLLESVETDLKDIGDRIKCIKALRAGDLPAALQVAVESLTKREKNKEKDNESK